MYLCPLGDLIAIDEALKFSVNKIRNKKILLTGATGFIGKNLLEAILWISEKNNLNVEIYSISRNPDKFFSRYPHFQKHINFKLFKGDIRDDLNILSIQKIDLTIHAATDVINPINAIDILDSCIEGTTNVLSLSEKLGCKSFLLLSSGAVYGKQPNGLGGVEETYIGGVDLQSPKSAYALGKKVSEWLSSQERAEHMRVNIARCFAFTGPYLPLDQNFAIGNFIECALRNRDVDIKGDGTPLRTYLYTSDLCIWLLKMLLSDVSDVFNVGGDVVVSIAELANIVKEAINPDIGVRVQQISSGITERYVPNISKIKRELGLSPTVGLKDAIIKTANWNLGYANFK
jgi:nucleoside-diphosphate-sugar epimerase